MLARQRMPTRAFFARVGQHRGCRGDRAPVSRLGRGSTATHREDMSRHIEGGEGHAGKTCGVQMSIQ